MVQSSRKLLEAIVDGNAHEGRHLKAITHADLRDGEGEGGPLTLTRSSVASVIRRLLNREISSKDAPLWASFVRRGYVEVGGGPLGPILILFSDDGEVEIANAVARLDELGDQIDGVISTRELQQMLNRLIDH